MAAGHIEAEGLDEIVLGEGDRVSLMARFKARQMDQLIDAIERGDPLTVGFANQSQELGGAPQSMREALAAHCRGEKQSSG
ncbi:MAG: hypothetical protein ACX930_06345 [Erythrobacter sp.]